MLIFPSVNEIRLSGNPPGPSREPVLYVPSPFGCEIAWLRKTLPDVFSEEGKYWGRWTANARVMEVCSIRSMIVLVLLYPEAAALTRHAGPRRIVCQVRFRIPTHSLPVTSTISENQSSKMIDE